MVAVFRVPAHVPFEGLLQPNESPLWDHTVAGAASWAIEKAGFSESTGVPEGPCLLLRDRVAVRPEALQAAWELGQERGESCSLVLGGECGEFLQKLPGSESGPVLAYLSDGEVPDQLGRLPQVVLEPAEKSLDLTLHDAKVQVYLSDRLLMPLDHWVDLLWANLLGLGPRIWGRALGRPAFFAVLRLIWGALRSLSVRHEKIAARLNVLGDGCRIHPSAVVEACVLGKGVSVGAGAVLRGCILGDGVSVEELVVCEGVVAGKGALIQRQALIKYAVMASGAAIGGATQLSVMGADSSLKRGGFGMDQSFDGAVRYRIGGLLLEAPHGLLGICLGENSKIGAGVAVAPGRAISPGCRIIAGAVVDPTVDEPGLYRVEAGRLEPLK